MRVSPCPTEGIDPSCGAGSHLGRGRLPAAHSLEQDDQQDDDDDEGANPDVHVAAVTPAIGKASPLRLAVPLRLVCAGAAADHVELAVADADAVVPLAAAHDVAGDVAGTGDVSPQQRPQVVVPRAAVGDVAAVVGEDPIVAGVAGLLVVAGAAGHAVVAVAPVLAVVPRSAEDPVVPWAAVVGVVAEAAADQVAAELAEDAVAVA